MEILRFFTAGNVDDGKSTLIGRLLLDSNVVSTDVIETLTRQSATKGTNAPIDLALLTDGLRAEREQGITIDVAYKYFTTAHRKYIIADTPGHVQYTRNMFTGASTANVALILVDARNGISEQTKRHSIISAILGIPQVLICVNKMDLVDYSEKRFNEIIDEFNDFSAQIGINQTAFIPVSALVGDNVVTASDNMPWYSGNTLFQFLESVDVSFTNNQQPLRFQVQYVIRPQSTELHDYRGYAGTVLAGELKVGDSVTLVQSGISTRISAIEKNQTSIQLAQVGEPIVVHLEDQVGVNRGEMLALSNQLPKSEKLIRAIICWMDTAEFQQGQKFILQQKSFRSKALIKEICSKIDIHSFAKNESNGTLNLNELAEVEIRTADLMSFDSFSDNKKTGAFILINEYTHQTVAAGVIQ